jgi:acylphosphatase
MVKSVAMVISGRVQGVFFRKYTLDVALRLGVSGFVCNKDDGTVYIEASGRADQVDQLIDWCHKGSPASKVQQVSCKEIDIVHHHWFEIR